MNIHFSQIPATVTFIDHNAGSESKFASEYLFTNAVTSFQFKMSVTSLRKYLRLVSIARCIGAVGLVQNLAVHADGWNDTGQTACYTGTGIVVACSLAATDGRYGRDAAALVGVLPKVGAGTGGFDFTKLANNGTPLPAGAALGSNATDWGCTLDNVTGLTWEVKTGTNTDLRYTGHTYTWYSTASNNGGFPGELGSDTCNGTLAAYSNQCNTANYVLAVNAAEMCGQSDWRLPTVTELQGIINFGAVFPLGIDPSYFPNSQSYFYRTSNSWAPAPWFAWLVAGDGSVFPDSKTYGLYVRLVRGGK